MSIAEQEQKFSDRIDCSFPFRDKHKAAQLIAEGRSISPNAAFCVLYEIVCPPTSEKVSERTQRDLLAVWADNATFPLAASIAQFARQILDGQPVSAEQALALMHEVGTVDGQYAALTVVSHLAYAVQEGVDFALIDTLEEQIRTRWGCI